MFRHGLAAFTLLLLATACRPPGDGAVDCGQLDPRNDDEVALCNELDQAVIARVAYPAGDPPAQGWPGVVVLHGSTGLFFAQDEGCSETMQDQFRIWADMLTERGYAVIMPASFYSRGFCDWTDTKTVPRKLDDHERLIVRTFDGAAAADHLCADGRVDCERIATLGFSNGASTVMMLMHHDHSQVADARLRELGNLPQFVGGVAYYPGCGLEGELAFNTDAANQDRFYYPSAPLWVPHAEKDKLLDTCEELRDPQVDVVAESLGVNDDMFEIEVYADAKHGFDVWFTGDPQADLDARIDAQARTLALFEAWF